MSTSPKEPGFFAEHGQYQVGVAGRDHLRRAAPDAGSMDSAPAIAHNE